MTAGPAWIEVLIAMVHAGEPEPPVHGVIRSRLVGGHGVGWTAFGKPVYLGPTGDEWTEWRVWRDGAKVRVETGDGRLCAISDGDSSWRFDAGSEIPVHGEARVIQWAGSAPRLLLRRSAGEFVGDDFTRPAGPIGTTTFLGRPAWTVDFAPPPRKPHRLQQIVDCETGIVLQQRSDGVGGVLDEWLTITVGERLADDLFTWTGPVVTAADEQRRMAADLAARRDAGRQWFAANVTGAPLVAALTVDLAVEYLHTFDDATGAFEASIGQGPSSGSLARRPRSAAPWDLRWGATGHRWSTRAHDWAISIHHVELDAAALADLQAKLHPGEPVISQ